jgi:1-aminocyclopropane-1-carboxylate deaminase
MHFSTEEILQPIYTTWLPADIQAAMLRLDRIHPVVSGNKWFKLKYNLEAAAGRPIVTFGGAYSNHIVATAAACGMAGIPCTGIIRGEEPAVKSHTLELAASLGMEMMFVSREAYRLKDVSAFPDAYVIPEGGHNALGAKGCSEILSLAGTGDFSHIICAVGTGTTLAGLVNAVGDDRRQVIGISALKGADSLYEETQALLTNPGGGDGNHDSGRIAEMQSLQPAPENNWTILHQFHEGGYGKVSDRLIAFMNDFYRQTGIPTDRVYTGKMVLAVQQLLEQSYFPPNSRLLLIHTGGLQGNDSLPPGVLCY